ISLAVMAVFMVSDLYKGSASLKSWLLALIGLGITGILAAIPAFFAILVAQIDPKESANFDGAVLYVSPRKVIITSLLIIGALLVLFYLLQGVAEKGRILGIKLAGFLTSLGVMVSFFRNEL